MAERIIHSVWNGEPDAVNESSTTSETYQDKISLTFTPEDSSTYLILASWNIRNSSPSYHVLSRLRRTSGTATDLFIHQSREGNSNSRHEVLTGVVETFGTSPGAQTYVIQFCTSLAGTTAYIKDVDIVAIKLVTNDKSAESTSRDTTTSATYQDKTTLTFTPGSTGDYIIIATGVIDSGSTSVPVKARITVDGTMPTTCECSIANANNSAGRYPFAQVYLVNLDASSHTIKIQYCAGTGGTTVGIEYARLQALRLDEWPHNYYEQELAYGTGASSCAYTTSEYESTMDQILLLGGQFCLESGTNKYVGVGLSDTHQNNENIYHGNTGSTVTMMSAFQVRKHGPDPPDIQPETTQVQIVFNKELGAACGHQGCFSAMLQPYHGPRWNGGTMVISTNEFAVATPTYQLDVPISCAMAGTGAMAPKLTNNLAVRKYYTQQDLAQSTNNLTTYADKVTLTFTPEDNSSYLIIATWNLQESSTSYQALARLYRSSGTAAALNEEIYRPKDTSDYIAGGCAAVESYGTSPGAQTYIIQFRSNSTSGTARIKDAKIIALKLVTADKSAESTTRSTTTLIAFQDKTTLTFTPDTAGYYLILATAIIDASSTSYSTRAQISIDATGYHEADYRPQTSATTNRIVYATAYVVSLTAASHTIKIQYCSSSTSGTAGIAYARLQALRLDEFVNYAYDLDSGDSSQSTVSYQDKSSATPPSTDFEQLVISTCSLGGSGTSYSAYFAARYGTTTIWESLLEPVNATMANYNLSQIHAWIEGNTTRLASDFVNSWRTESAGTNATIRNSVIALMQLEKLNPNLATVIAGSGGMAAALTVTTGNIVSLISTMAGTGAMVGKLDSQQSLKMTSAGAGAMVPNLTQDIKLVVTFGGTGELSGLLIELVDISTAMAGTGAMAGKIDLQPKLVAVMGGAGELSAVATVTREIPLVVTMEGIGGMDCFLSRDIALSCTMGGTGGMVVTCDIQPVLQVSFAGAGTFTPGVLPVERIIQTLIGGTASLSARIGYDIPISTLIEASSGLSGPLSVDRDIAVTIAATSSVSGILILDIGLKTSFDGAGAVTPALTITGPILISCTMAGTGAMAGQLDLQPKLVTSFDGVGTLTPGLLPVERGLSTLITGASSITGTLTKYTDLITVMAGTGAMVPGATVTWSLKSTMAGTGELYGVLMVEGEVSIAAVMSASGAMVGSLTRYMDLKATMPGLSGVETGVSVDRSLTVALQGQGSLAGLISKDISCVAKIEAIGDLSGSLLRDVNLFTAMSGLSDLQARVTGEWAIRTLIPGSGQLSAKLTTADLAVIMAGSGSLSALLSADISLKTHISGVLVLQGTLEKLFIVIYELTCPMTREIYRRCPMTREITLKCPMTREVYINTRLWT